MKPPIAPPSLKAMSARIEYLEFERRRIFTIWKDALEKSNGNVTVAGENFNPPHKKAWANKLVGKLGLAEYARQLRIDKTGKDRGTPKRR